MKSLVRHPSFNWILGVVVAYCFLLLSTTAEAAVVGSAKSKPNPDNNLQDVITLHSEQGPICPANSKRAVYFVAKTNESVEGCYVVKDKAVHLGFVDGDNGALPVEMFQWAAGTAPSSGNDKPGVGPGRDTNGTPRRQMPIIAQRGGGHTVAGWM
jgi:hypothetical protein